MSFSYERYDRRQSGSRRTTLGYWVPLALTVTLATAGIAAWIWSEREQDDSSSDDADLSYGEDKENAAPPSQGPDRRGYPGDGSSYSQSQGVAEEGTFMSRMSDVIRRTPSPQQMFDIASRRVVSGVAAAGAVVGGALSSIREEEKDDYADHSRWSEEAVLRRNVEAQSAESSSAVAAHTDAFAASARGAAGSQSLRPGARRRTVAVVISAAALEGFHEEDDGSLSIEHAVSPPTRSLDRKARI